MYHWKILLGVGILLFAGCGTKKPDGIPALHPVKVKITKGDKPVVKANVFLVATTATSGSWSVAGLTDVSGVATIETSQGNWKAKGTPEGEYKIYMTKVTGSENWEWGERPAEDASYEVKVKYSEEMFKRVEAATKEIPKSLTVPKTSDLKITVVAGKGANETFDISKYE